MNGTLSSDLKQPCYLWDSLPHDSDVRKQQRIPIFIHNPGAAATIKMEFAEISPEIPTGGR